SRISASPPTTSSTTYCLAGGGTMSNRRIASSRTASMPRLRSGVFSWEKIASAHTRGSVSATPRVGTMTTSQYSGMGMSRSAREDAAVVDGVGAEAAGPVSARSAWTFSLIGACCPLRARSPRPSRRSLLPALCSELGQFVLEPLVAAVDPVDSVDGGNALGPQRGDQVGEPSPQVRDGDVGRPERLGAGDDRGVVVVAVTEAAAGAAQALPVDLGVGAHVVERRGEAEPVLVHRLVDDGDAVGLREGDDQGLLPVRHQPGVDVGLHGDRPQRGARMIEPD